MARGILGSPILRGPRTTGPLAQHYRGGGPVQYYGAGGDVPTWNPNAPSPWEESTYGGRVGQDPFGSGSYMGPTDDPSRFQQMREFFQNLTGAGIPVGEHGARVRADTSNNPTGMEHQPGAFTPSDRGVGVTVERPL